MHICRNSSQKPCANPKSRNHLRERAGAVESLERRRLFTTSTVIPPFGLTDTNFGVKGHVVASGNGGVTQVTVGPNGTIYAAGSNGIARFTAAGKIDTSFNGTGFVGYSGGTTESDAVDAAGNLYLLIATSSGTAVMRYTAGGVVDNTFGSQGSVIVTTDTAFSPKYIAVESNDKLVIVGTESTNSDQSATLRVFGLNADGSTDTSFASGGSLETTLGQAASLTPIVFDQINGINVLSNGDLLIGGASVAFSTSTNGAQPVFAAPVFATVELTPIGLFVSGYGSNGVVRNPFATAADVNASYYGDPQNILSNTVFNSRADGSAVFATDFYNVNDVLQHPVVAFNSAGSASFSTSLKTDVLSNGTPLSGAALSDGRFVLVTQASDMETGVALTEFSAAGVQGSTVVTDDLDSTTPDISGDYSTAVAVASDGDLLVGGTNDNGSGLDVQAIDAGSATAAPANYFAAGSVSSVAVASTETVNVAYYDTAASDLVFVQRARNGLWSSPITVDAKHGAGESLSLATDSKGNPAIAYYDAKSHSLKLATSADQGKHFTIKVIDDSANVGEYVSLAFNGTTPAIAYYDRTNENLKFATENSKKKWTTSIIDSKGNVGADPVLGLTTNSSRFAIAYLDNTRHLIKFAEQSHSGSFTIKNVVSTTSGAESLSMSLTANPAPAIAYHDLASGYVNVATYDGSAFVVKSLGNVTGQATAVRPDGNDVDVFSYSKATNSVTEFTDAAFSSQQSTVITAGGKYFTLDASGDFAGFVDSTTGDLVVELI